MTNLHYLLRKQKTQINIRNERGDITTGTTTIHRNIRNYYQQLCGNKLHNLEEMVTFLTYQD